MWKSLCSAIALCVLAMPANAQITTVKKTIVDTMTIAEVSFLPMHVGGKVRQEELGYRYQWPGVYFEAQFSSPFVNMMFNDDANNFNVILDGKPLMILRKPGHRTITVQAEGYAPHTIRLEKRSETQYATGHFQGFMASPSAQPLPRRARQIEFIGDSLTVGYGNTSAYRQCTAEEIFETTDSQQGFGPIIAKQFDADYQINAFSGLGMVRNFGGYEHDRYRMPTLYPRALFDDPTPAESSGWTPDVIVIGIGGNDFSTQLHEGETWASQAELRADYEATYVRFVKGLREKNPGAFLILTSPDGRGDYTDGTTAVFEALKSGGETRIARLLLPATQSTGCNGHPNTRDDAAIAEMLTGWLENHPEAWSSAH